MTDQGGGVLSANAALRALFQVPPSSPVVGRPAIEVIRHPQVLEAIERTLRSGEQTAREIALPGAGERRLEGHFAPIRLSGAIIGAVGIFYDMTQIRRIERMRKDFVANVSHELRTPLTAIRGCAETLAEGAIEDREAARRFVGAIQSHAERLSALIDDLLSLSRIESGAQELRRVPCSLAPLVEAALGVVEAAAAQKGIVLDAEIPAGLPEVLCDRALIEQALVNLLDNAVKYTPPGGKVAVRARGAAGRVVVVEEDTGIGIPAEHLPRVFERFYRVDRARARALGGTGLGLSIVKHLVEAHGGSVRATSEVGKGSVFTIALPASG